MKKYILMLLIATGFSLFHIACGDGLDDYKSEFDTILYFRDSGELPVTLYRTGNNTDYGLIITKAGFEQKNAVVSVNVMNDAELTAYNAVNGVNYKALPSSCYVFENKEIQMAANDSYKEVNVSLVTEQIEMNIGTDATYVIPFELSEASDSINSQKKYVFIKPSVETIYVGFENQGLIETENIVDSEGSVDLNIPVILPVPNQWDMSYEVQIDEEVLDRYNESNGTLLGILPETSYSYDVLQFEQGERTTYVSVHIDKTRLPWGMKALPLRIKSISNDNFIINEDASTCIVSISHIYPRNLLVQIPLSLDMLSSNATEETDGTGLAGLFDGHQWGSHWHSKWDGTVVDRKYGHYIDFKLPRAINHFAYNFWSRGDNWYNSPKLTVIYAGNNGSDDWIEIGRVNNNFTFGDEEYDSDTFSSDTPFTYVRFSVIESSQGPVGDGGGGCWNCGEMEIYGK